MKSGLADFMLPCLTKRYLGFDCPGCGTQRAFVSLLDGDLTAALRYYPPIFTLLLLAGTVGLFLFKRNPTTQKAAIAMGIIHAIVVLVSYIFKLLS